MGEVRNCFSLYFAMQKVQRCKEGVGTEIKGAGTPTPEEFK